MNIRKRPKVLMDVLDILTALQTKPAGLRTHLCRCFEGLTTIIAVDILRRTKTESLRRDVERDWPLRSLPISQPDLHTPEGPAHYWENARASSRKVQDSKVGTEHILLAMVRETSRSPADSFRSRLN